MTLDGFCLKGYLKESCTCNKGDTTSLSLGKPIRRLEVRSENGTDLKFWGGYRGGTTRLPAHSISELNYVTSNIHQRGL